MTAWVYNEILDWFSVHFLPEAAAMIVQCPQCKNRSEVPDSLTGREVRCAQCKAIHTLQPMEEPPPILPQPEKTTQEKPPIPQSDKIIGNDKVAIKCPECRAVFRVRRELLGRKAGCPQCKKSILLAEHVKSAAVKAPPPIPKPSPLAPKQPPKLPPATPVAKTAVVAGDFLAELEALSQQSHTAQPPQDLREEILKIRRQLLQTLDGQLAVTEVPATYRVAVVIVGILMCLLTLVYIGMIVGGGVGMYQYWVYVFSNFQQVTESLSGSEGRVGIVTILVLVTPLLAIGAVLFFMIKPFLFGWRWKDTRLELTREREPFLFNFLDKLSHYIGAIPPTRVFVDCNVNAAASFRHGIWSAIFGGQRCDLTLGLPLVVGMNMSQLAGVIAHEFGHFTQGGGMRFSNIIRTITYWFLRVVYERDRFDQYIVALSTSGHIFNIIVFMIVRVIVWLVRRVLWCLMMIGFAVSGFLSRQMEFDADQFETRIIGSKSFRNSTRRLLGLGISNAKSNYDINQMFKDELLVDNYPRLIAANSEIIADNLDKWVDEHIQQNQKTGWFDTHPSDAARIEHAESLEAEGVMHLDCPATVLFDNFDGVAREVTWHFYTVENGLDIKQSALKASEIVIGELKAEANRGKTIGRYYQGLFRDRVAEALPLQRPAAPPDPNASKAEIRAIRKQITKIREPLEKTLEEIGKIENDIWQLRVVTLLQNCKGVYAGLFTPEPPQRRYADNLMEKNRLEFALQSKIDQTEPDFQRMAKRLHLGLSLLMLDPVMRRIDDGKRLCNRAALLYPMSTRLSKLHQKFFALYQQRILVVMLLYSMRKAAHNQNVHSMHQTEIKNINDALYEGLNSVCSALNEIPYPYDHAQGKVTLQAALAPGFDGTNHDLEHLINTAEMIRERFGTLLGRIYLELVSIAETVETTIGLQPLPDLPDKEEEKKEPEKKGRLARLLGG
jgi:predicted Zn finger-like uncharacterized protein